MEAKGRHWIDVSVVAGTAEVVLGPQGVPGADDVAIAGSVRS